MKWIVEGANPRTGTELKRTLDALSASEAESMARARGMLVATVRPEIEACENCGRKFGALELPREVAGHVICVDCIPRVDHGEPPATAQRVLSYAGPVDAPPKVPDGRAAIVDRRQRYANYGLRRCPGCGSSSAPVKRPKGSMTVGVLLTLFMVLPGVLYFIFFSGHVYACPDCGMKLGDAT